MKRKLDNDVKGNLKPKNSMISATTSKKGIRRRILIYFALLFLVISIIPVVYFGFTNASNVRQYEERTRWEIMEGETNTLATEIKYNLIGYKNLFNEYTSLSEIKDLMEWRLQNSTLTNEFNALTAEQKIKGDFYPQRINNTDLYNIIYKFFKNSYDLNLGAEMIRVFYQDGNVLVGVKNGAQDMKDYKGDKSWFKDTMKITDPDYIYVSPISIARATNTPAIRIMKPIVIDNVTRGLIVANFGVSYIVNPILNYGEKLKAQDRDKNEFFAMIDLNYETAEGDLLGEVYIANTLNNSLSFDEPNGGKIVYKSSMFTQTNGTGSIFVNDLNYYYYYQKITLDNRDWYLIHNLVASEFVKETQAAVLSTIQYLIMVLVLVAFLGTLIIIFISRKLANPIVDLQKTMIQVRNGDLSVESPKIKTNDEIEALSDSFESLLSRLKNLFTVSSKLSEKLAISAEELSSSAEEVSSSSENIASSQTQISKGASEQVLAITDVQRKISNLTEGIKLINVRVEEISEISDLISNIAKQTNMLALNAAIEAARAGEAGRGFNVVAEQVRKLADESRTAVLKTNSMLEDIQNKTKEQEMAAMQIVSSIDRIATVAEETSASTEEAASTAEQQASSLEVITNTAQQLLSLAEDLRDQFKGLRINKEDEFSDEEELNESSQPIDEENAESFDLDEIDDKNEFEEENLNINENEDEQSGFHLDTSF